MVEEEYLNSKEAQSEKKSQEEDKRDIDLDSDIDPLNSQDELSLSEEDSTQMPAHYRFYAIRIEKSQNMRNQFHTMNGDYKRKYTKLNKKLEDIQLDSLRQAREVLFMH